MTLGVRGLYKVDQTVFVGEGAIEVCRIISLDRPVCRHLLRGHAISVFIINYCLSWYKFADTYLYHSRQWFNILLKADICFSARSSAREDFIFRAVQICTSLLFYCRPM